MRIAWNSLGLYPYPVWCRRFVHGFVALALRARECLGLLVSLSVCLPLRSSPPVPLGSRYGRRGGRRVDAHSNGVLPPLPRRRNAARGSWRMACRQASKLVQGKSTAPRGSLKSTALHILLYGFTALLYVLTSHTHTNFLTFPTHGTQTRGSTTCGAGCILHLTGRGGPACPQYCGVWVPLAQQERATPFLFRRG